MSGNELDSTMQSFPPYAELTQTQGWGAGAAKIRADANEGLDAVEVSHGSRYTEGPVLGTGGMGKVVLARDGRIGRDVAVKVLHPERELEPADRSRFLREAQVQGQLEHPAIVPVYDIERRPDGSTFFTMRRVHGRTLAAILDDLRKGVPAAKARYTQRELLTAFGTVCLAVDYAHTRGVVHRDLKPANIMLGDFGEVYVLDWGLARLIEEGDDDDDALAEQGVRLSLPGSFLGTPLYMAPEQMADPDVGPRADVYSLGLMLFELLTLERARDPNAVFAPVDARPSVRAPHRGIAPELETICVKATELAPDARYPSARALQEAIARFLEGDREIEQRRQLAAAHVRAARVALARSEELGAKVDTERGLAVTELGRAVALDPNGAHVAMLAELMSTPPSTIPAEVVAQIESDNQRLMHVGAKQSVFALLSWWLFVPVMLWIGFHQVVQIFAIAVPVVLGLLSGVLLMRRRTASRLLQYATLACMVAAGIGVSRIYGPYVLLPTVLITYAIVVQAHPWREMRIAGAVMAAVSIVAPALLEWAGWLAPSYIFNAGRWTIVPQLIELPELGTHVLLLLANLGMIIIPCLFIAKLRESLGEAQLRLAVQAWHFKQMGARLIGRAETAEGLTLRLGRTAPETKKSPAMPSSFRFTMVRD
jgi:eukaryotic-like serine/threonine-protein kinase